MSESKLEPLAAKAFRVGHDDVAVAVQSSITPPVDELVALQRHPRGAFARAPRRPALRYRSSVDHRLRRAGGDRRSMRSWKVTWASGKTARVFLEDPCFR